MKTRTRRFTGLLLMTLLCGCEMQMGKDEGAMPPKRVPAGGKVTLDGKPLAAAVVTFLPVDERGTITVADVKEDGSYELTYQTFPGGTAPGSYKVAVSYLIDTEGKPVDLTTRSALAVPKSVIEAVERLPKKYSDLGKTELAASVPPEGGTFDFALEGPLLPGPEVKADAEDAEAEEGGEAEPTPADPANPKPEADPAQGARPE